MKNRSHGAVLSLKWYRLNRFAVAANITVMVMVSREWYEWRWHSCQSRRRRGRIQKLQGRVAFRLWLTSVLCQGRWAPHGWLPPGRQNSATKDGRRTRIKQDVISSTSFSVLLRHLFYPKVWIRKIIKSNLKSICKSQVSVLQILGFLKFESTLKSGFY